jgi:hypothetical protein
VEPIGSKAFNPFRMRLAKVKEKVIVSKRTKSDSVYIDNLSLQVEKSQLLSP